MVYGSAILTAIAIVAALLCLVAAASAAHALLRIADDLRDEHAQHLGIGGDSFPHERGTSPEGDR